MERLFQKSARELARLIRSGNLSPVELMETTLQRIASVNPALNAFVSLRADAALKEAATLAEHITAEYCVRTEARGWIVDEWKLRAGSPDNHWFDCLVGCAVAASMLGLSVTGPATRERKVRQKRRRKVAYL